jgi:hypothetical protein
MDKPKPKFNEALFWDVDPQKIDYDKWAKYVVERVVSSGSMKDWQALKKYYGLEKIKDVVKNQSRYLDNVTLNFLSFYFGEKKESFKCFERKQLTQELWPY